MVQWFIYATCDAVIMNVLLCESSKVIVWGDRKRDDTCSMIYISASQALVSDSLLARKGRKAIGRKNWSGSGKYFWYLWFFWQFPPTTTPIINIIIIHSDGTVRSWEGESSWLVQLHWSSCPVKQEEGHNSSEKEPTYPHAYARLSAERLAKDKLIVNNMHLSGSL
jgi:hypothetical protein